MYTLNRIFPIILILLFCGNAIGADITLMWDRPSSDEQEYITHGYRIYAHAEGEDYDFTTPTKWGWKGQLCNTPAGSPSEVCMITFKDVNEKMYFVATAYTSLDNVGTTQWPESPPSNEAIYIPPNVNDIDDDGDGYSENTGDCNDSDASIYPGSIEVCDDGIDNNCDGNVDEDCEEPPQPPEKVELRIQAVSGSYLYDGTHWYKITPEGLIEVDHP